MSALLLDTCAVIWTVNDERMSNKSREAIESAEHIFASPITAWEIANLVSKGRLTLSMAPETWFDVMLTAPGMKLAPMPPRTLMASAFLPGTPPNDPADRIILATARSENLVVVTRDRELLSYAEAGHVRALEC